MMIVHLLQRRAIGARFEPAGALSMSGFANWNTDGVESVCLCYVEHVSGAEVRYAVRRIRRKITDAKIVVALLWDSDEANDPDAFGDVRLAHPTTAAAVDTILATVADQSVPPQMSSLEATNGQDSHP